MGCCLPIAGGNWFRQLPHTLLKKAVKNWDETHADPFVMYFHIWELDPDQPRISAADRLSRIRHYRNLDKMQWVLEDHLSKYSFGTVADRLGLETRSVDRAKGQGSRVEGCDVLPASTSGSKPLPLDPRPSALQPVSIVIPCYNEEASLPYLGRTLNKLEAELADRYEPTFVLVDDRSTDSTWEIMQSVFGSKPNFRLVRHEQNSGVSAAILTGIRHSETELVCSMDCDCSYDPLEFSRMLPLMTDDVDLVTASPYHPEGRVKNVPSWRLLLSKGLSTIYRIVLPQKLHTWTSCFRVYRKSAIEKLSLHETGFLGTAELVGQLCLNGSKIVEHPATLEVLPASRRVGHRRRSRRPGSKASRKRHRLRTALHPEAGILVPGLPGPGDVRRKPLALHARPPGSRRLRRSALPRHLRSSSRCPGSALERSLRPGTHRLHRQSRPCIFC